MGGEGASNYPPGVTGSEPQIVGDPAWEQWADALSPGDRCRVWWQGVTWDAAYLGESEGPVGLARVSLDAGPVRMEVDVDWEDMSPPEGGTDG